MRTQTRPCKSKKKQWFAAFDGVTRMGPYRSDVAAWKAMESAPEDGGSRPWDRGGERLSSRRVHVPGARVWPELAAVMVAILLTVAACGGKPEVGGVDAATAADAMEAPLDAAGLPLGVGCSPLADQCQPGLTCRILGATDGVCLQAGTTAEGDLCDSVAQCGPDMTCLPAELGRFRCVVVCDVTGAVGPNRCRVGALCQRYWSDAVGFCR